MRVHHALRLAASLALASPALPEMRGLVAQVPVAAPRLLDVPYLPQTELLCGGAAVAMVERWWGKRGVYAEDFAALVKPARGGIVTTELAAAARERGWRVQLVEGGAEAIEASLGAGVPVVALIQVGPARYHYVVVLGWSSGRVTYHDPARKP